jgi:hypothetical protein
MKLIRQFIPGFGKERSISAETYLYLTLGKEKKNFSTNPEDLQIYILHRRGSKCVRLHWSTCAEKFNCSGQVQRQPGSILISGQFDTNRLPFMNHTGEGSMTG